MTWSFPVRERGLKQSYMRALNTPEWSFPVRERGLKHKHQVDLTLAILVVPRAGTWIETPLFAQSDHPRSVVPRAGTWIETI